jgi:hypothetical protein
MRTSLSSGGGIGRGRRAMMRCDVPSVVLYVPHSHDERYDKIRKHNSEKTRTLCIKEKQEFSAMLEWNKCQ